jgi:hypothetical protein
MLKLGAYCNFGIAFLHVMLGFAGEKMNRFFGAPEWVLEMLKNGRIGLLLLLTAMAAVFSLFAVYALSGAGSLRRLPLLRTGLITIGAIYSLRGLELIIDVPLVIRLPGRYMQFLVFSLVSLCIGILYLAGTIANWSSIKPTRT